MERQGEGLETGRVLCERERERERQGEETDSELRFSFWANLVSNIKLKMSTKMWKNCLTKIPIFPRESLHELFSIEFEKTPSQANFHALFSLVKM